jgi:hypothetical protein
MDYCLHHIAAGRNVMLVHGEGEKMKFLKNKIKQEHGIECYMPANGETAVISVPATIPARISGIANYQLQTFSLFWFSIVCLVLNSLFWFSIVYFGSQ